MSDIVENKQSLKIEANDLLKLLKTISGVIDKGSQILQVLSYVKIEVDNQKITFTATDSEVEIISQTIISTEAETKLTAMIPGKKLMDITRTLPAGDNLVMSFYDQWIIINTDSGLEFKLATLDHSAFPTIPFEKALQSYTIPSVSLGNLMRKTAFAMGQNQV